MASTDYFCFLFRKVASSVMSCSLPSCSHHCWLLKIVGCEKSIYPFPQGYFEKKKKKGSPQKNGLISSLFFFGFIRLSLSPVRRKDPVEDLPIPNTTLLKFQRPGLWGGDVPENGRTNKGWGGRYRYRYEEGFATLLYTVYTVRVPRYCTKTGKPPLESFSCRLPD